MTDKGDGDSAEALRKVLAAPCPVKRPLAHCRLAEWRRIGHVAHMTRTLIEKLLRIHREHANEP